MSLSFINRRTVKWLALMTMLLDHIAGRMVLLQPDLFQNLLVLRSIGRIAFPLFAFQMGVSFHKTQNLPRLLGQLFILALLSEIPYDLKVHNSITILPNNVIWTFLMAGLAIYIGRWLANHRPSLPIAPVTLTVTLPLALGADFLKMDYGFKGVLMTVLFFLFAGQKWLALLPLILINPDLASVYPWLYCPLVVSMSCIYCYEDRWQPFGKWEARFYHYFYPLHLLLLALIMT